ncbi:hypothetical protein ACFFHM_02440 [Halalkalibacter kiskunsagensis]|uniref:Transposase n=1 Tax=Halalkalibacter kiskunsagensis TaxID=1548599 RepID=A0ABV6K926_9BACI
MNIWTKSKGARHALVIEDHVIRYAGSKRPQLEAIYAVEKTLYACGCD